MGHDDTMDHADHASSSGVEGAMHVGYSTLLLAVPRSTLRERPCEPHTSCLHAA